MKKLLLLAMLFISATAFSQKIYDVVGIQFSKWENEKWEIGERKDCELKMKITKDQLFINNKEQTHLFFTEFAGEVTGIDNDGDEYICTQWETIDQRENGCFLLIQRFDNLKIFIVSLMYNDYCIKYYVNKD